MKYKVTQPCKKRHGRDSITFSEYKIMMAINIQNFYLIQEKIILESRSWNEFDQNLVAFPRAIKNQSYFFAQHRTKILNDLIFSLKSNGS